jgi:hypothetical protein
MAGLSLGAILTIDMMVAHDELKGHPPHPLDLFCMGVDFHVLPDGFGAGGYHLPAASDFNLHQAETASPKRKFSPLGGTEMRDIDPRTERGPEDFLSRACCDFLTINGKGGHDVSFYRILIPLDGGGRYDSKPR